MSEKPFLWSDFLDQLPELPSLDGTDLHSALLGDWWQWYWQLVQDNAPPLTEADAYSVLSGNVLQVHAGNGVLANDQDFDSPLITALLAEAPLHGTVELSVDGGFTYRPENLFTGSDTFAYRAFDLRSTSPSTTVTITVESDLPIAGDFNGDGVIDVRDVDQLATAIRTDLQSRFDLNDDGLVDHSDLDYLVTSILHSTAGDANLDGRFDVADLISVFQAGQYEDERPDNSGWASGDWNGDGEFDSADLLEAFQAGSFVRASVRTSRWLIGAALAD